MNAKTVIQVMIGVALAGSAAAGFDALRSPSVSSPAPVQGEAAAVGGAVAFLLPPLSNQFVLGGRRPSFGQAMVRQIIR